MEAIKLWLCPACGITEKDEDWEWVVDKYGKCMYCRHGTPVHGTFTPDIALAGEKEQGERDGKA